MNKKQTKNEKSHAILITLVVLGILAAFTLFFSKLDKERNQYWEVNYQNCGRTGYVLGTSNECIKAVGYDSVK